MERCDYNKIIKTCIFVLGLSLGSFAYADLEMTHIMYNPEGADDGYEYVVVKNTSGASLDISNYFFLENNVHHGLYPESTTLSSGDSAWVVKDIETARSRYGDNHYVKSSFSLNNTGETLAFTDPDRVVINEFSYTSDMGGNGDGTALVLGSGSSTSTNSDSPSETSTASSGNSTSSSEEEAFDPYYQGYIDMPNTIVATNDISIQAGVIHKRKNKDTHKKNGYYYLNFGNGHAEEHYERIDTIYNYPAAGKYRLVLEYYHGKLAKEHAEPDAITFRDITVIEPKLRIISYDSFKGVTLRNDSGSRIDIEGWHLVSGSDVYTFPKYSSIGAGQDLIIAREHTGFTSPVAQTLRLLNPDYLSIHHYDRVTPRYEKTRTSTAKALKTGLVESDVVQDIEIGINTLVQDDQEFVAITPTAIHFPEDDLVFETDNAPGSTKLPLYIFAGCILVLVAVKSVIGKSHKKTTHETEKRYDIELIE